MKDTRNLFSPLALRPLLASLIGLALVCGWAAPHDTSVERAGMRSGVAIAETAVHPGAPEHFERAEIKLHPGCTACLMQLGSGTILDRSPAPQQTLPPGGAVAALIQQAFSRKPSLLGPARAPPIVPPAA